MPGTATRSLRRFAFARFFEPFCLRAVLRWLAASALAAQRANRGFSMSHSGSRGLDHPTRNGSLPVAVATSSRSPARPRPLPATLKAFFVHRAVQ